MELFVVGPFAIIGVFLLAIGRSPLQERVPSHSDGALVLWTLGLGFTALACILAWHFTKITS